MREYRPYLTGYHLVTRGDSCGSVLSKHECEEAAFGLGLLDTTAFQICHPAPPPHCFFENKILYFNTFISNTSCSDRRGQCVCKLPCTKVEGCPGEFICGPDKYCHQCINDEHCPGELICGLDKRCHEQSGKYFFGQMWIGLGTSNTQVAQDCDRKSTSHGWLLVVLYHIHIYNNFNGSFNGTRTRWHQEHHLTMYLATLVGKIASDHVHHFAS